MGLRETLNEKPAITTAVISAIIVVCIAVVIYMTAGGGSGGGSDTTAKFYYSDDDGATFFADDAGRIPPFDHKGKQAVRAHVFIVGGNKVVGYLERYTPEAKKKREAQRSGGPPEIIGEDFEAGIEVKAPKTGDGGWMKKIDPRARAITTIRGAEKSTLAEEAFAE